MDRTIAYKILHYLQEQESVMADFLKKLVKAESPSNVPESQGEVINMLDLALQDCGYFTLHIPGKNTGGHLYGRPYSRNKGEPLQLILGHCDTVWPMKTLEEMPVLLDENKMSGPGTYDMKAGLAQMIFALRALREFDLNPEVMPLVLINSDEEIGSHESRPWIRRLARLVDRAFVLEPSLGPEGKLKTSRKGVGRYTIVVKGKAAHAGLEPGKGASAIVELSHVVQTLFAMNDPGQGLTVNVGMIEGGLRANVVAPESRAVVDVRVPTQADAERIEAQILTLKPVDPDVQIEISGGIGRAPMEATPRNRRLWQLAMKMGQLLGTELEEATAGGGSDGNITSLYTATLDGLGAVGAGAHAIHEFAYVDKLPERAALLALLILAKPIQ